MLWNYIRLPAGCGFVSKIVALVNGEIISNEDIQNRINAFLLTTRIPFNAQTRGMITQRVLNAAIDEQIKLQEAAKNGIEISEEEVNNSLRQFERSHKIPMGQLNTILKQADVNPDTFASQMKSDLAWLRLVRKKSYADGTLTQKEVENALQEAKDDLTTPKYLISEIYIKKTMPKTSPTLFTTCATTTVLSFMPCSFQTVPAPQTVVTWAG